MCSHTQFWFVSVVSKYFQFATSQKISLLSLYYSCVSHILNDTQIFTSFSQHTFSDPPPSLLRTFFLQTPHLIYQPHKMHFMIKLFHAGLLCVATRCCSWPTIRCIKMEVSCDMTSQFSTRCRRFGITSWLKGSLSYSEDLSRNFPQVSVLNYQNARCHSFDPLWEARILTRHQIYKTVTDLCLSNHHSL
jgi:hypothetical protein